MTLDALLCYAELITFLELTPWDGPPYREDNRGGNMRKMLFGRGAKGIAVYLVLEQERRVIVVSVTWVGLTGSSPFERPVVLHGAASRRSPRPQWRGGHANLPVDGRRTSRSADS